MQEELKVVYAAKVKGHYLRGELSFRYRQNRLGRERSPSPSVSVITLLSSDEDTSRQTLGFVLEIFLLVLWFLVFSVYS